MTNTQSALIVFAREPKDGKTKTRLLRHLPVKMVTYLYKDFVKTVLKTARMVNCNHRFIYYAGTGSSIPFLNTFANQFQLKRQMGQGLGERMHRAFIHCAKQKYNKIIIIGTDCLSLTKNELLRYAKILGSDVPFFLYDFSWAVGRERGDVVKRLILRRKLIVLPKSCSIIRDLAKVKRPRIESGATAGNPINPLLFTQK